MEIVFFLIVLLENNTKCIDLKTDFNKKLRKLIFLNDFIKAKPSNLIDFEEVNWLYFRFL